MNKGGDEMRRAPGYIVSIVGMAILLLSFEGNQDFVSDFIPLVKDFPGFYFAIAGVVILAIGLFLIKRVSGFRRPRRGGREVPIYHGDNVVGYRRT